MLGVRLAARPARRRVLSWTLCKTVEVTRTRQSDLTPHLAAGQTLFALPDGIVIVPMPFATLFQNRIWQKAWVLPMGAIIAAGQRTGTAEPYDTKLSGDRDHRVLNRAAWSPLEACQILLRRLLQYLDRGDGPLMFGIDETLEWCQGPGVNNLGVYRDAVRYSRGYAVKSDGFRCVSPMWLGHIPWAGRQWDLPLLALMATSERHYRHQGRRHEKFTNWICHLVLQMRCWLPRRPLVVDDNGYAMLDLPRFCHPLREPVTTITRLSLNAGLNGPAPPGQLGQIGHPRVKGPRQPALNEPFDDPSPPWDTVSAAWHNEAIHAQERASQTSVWYQHDKPRVPIRWMLIRDPKRKLDTGAPLCTRRDVASSQIWGWFALRWSAFGGEVAYQEMRTHLDQETERRWSNRAITRTALMRSERKKPRPNDIGKPVVRPSPGSPQR